MSFEVAPGTHSIQVSGGGLKTEKSFNLKPGQNLTLCTLFSNMGAMGGGLRLDEDQTGSPVSSQTKPDLNAERKSWSLKGMCRNFRRYFWIEPWNKYHRESNRHHGEPHKQHGEEGI